MPRLRGEHIYMSAEGFKKQNVDFVEARFEKLSLAVKPLFLLHTTTILADKAATEFIG